MSDIARMATLLEDHCGDLDETACYKGGCMADGCDANVGDHESEAVHRAEVLVAAGFGSIPAAGRTGYVPARTAATFNAHMTTVARPGTPGSDAQIISLHPDETQLTASPVIISLERDEFFEMATRAGETIHTTDLGTSSSWRDRGVRPDSVAILSPNPDLHGDYRRIEIGDRAIRVTPVKP